jgi:hypothetical protein
MPDLNFEVVGMEAPPYAAVPTLLMKLRISNADEQERIHSVALRCQIQIAAPKRRYNRETQARLLEVFGEPHRWAKTLRNLLWMHVSTVVTRFSGSIVTDLAIPCTYDFEVVGSKYFEAVREGTVPLLLLFSGTVFYENDEGNLQASQISWSKEAAYNMPVTLWQEMMALYFPGTAWIRLSKEVFDRLYRYRTTRGLPSWEESLLQLLPKSDEEAPK